MIIRPLSSRALQGRETEALKTIYELSTATGHTLDLTVQKTASMLAGILQGPQVLVHRFQGGICRMTYTCADLSTGILETPCQKISSCRFAQKGESCCANPDIVGPFITGSAAHRNQGAGTVSLPIRDREGSILGRLTALRRDGQVLSGDISATIELFTRYLSAKMEEEIKGTERLSAEAQSITWKFVEGLVMEVQEQLGSITSLASSLFQEVGDQKALIPLQGHLHSRADHLSVMMRKLKAACKPWDNTRLEPAPLITIVSSAMKIWNSFPTAANSPVRLLEDEESGSCLVPADRRRLQKAFIELMESAAAYNTNSKEVTLYINRPAGKTVRVQVIDCGESMVRETEKPYRSNFFSSHRTGQGIGLSLARHIIEGHGGTMSIASNSPPPGCTVEVGLPLA